MFGEGHARGFASNRRQGACGFKLTMPAVQPLLTIPSESESSAAFKERVAAIIPSLTTYVYVDTSFLMWMTKIGTKSRNELLDWLDGACPGRVHVPIWAAHEYLRHHVAGTIVSELSEKTKEIADLVGRTYSYFRPFVDEPIGGGSEDPATLRASTRDALNGLEHLAEVTRQWHKSYQSHATEVIAFINAHIPSTTDLYSYFPTIAALGTGRYVGSVPPGFQDRRKKGAVVNDAQTVSDEAPSGSNRFGDLLFWKEVLDHAKASKAKCIIILTNDRKNDWLLRRGDTANIEPGLLALRKSWNPVPRAHPMLALEAKVVAAVDDVILLDSLYLAVLLRELALEQVRAFADVAIIPDTPDLENEADRRDNALQCRLAADAEAADRIAAQRGIRFLDDPCVQFSPGALRRALLESRSSVGQAEAVLLDALHSDVGPSPPLSEILTQERLSGLDHKQLVRFARELHDRVLSEEPGYVETLTDLVSLIDEFPVYSAGCLYFGMLASMFLVRETNLARLPPKSPVAQLLFARQAAPYAALPIDSLVARLNDCDKQPLYHPSVDRPSVQAVFDVEPHSDLMDELRSLRITGVEVLTPAQEDPALSLATLFAPEATVSATVILTKACELFGIPTVQVEPIDKPAPMYALTPTIGFKRPQTVFVPKEELA